jgi:pyridoxamine 5'-phosphate oxidase
MANAMAVATTDLGGNPSVRMLLLDQVDARGFSFQTNIDSPKAHHLAHNPNVALTFWWPRLLRQVRVIGTTEPLPAEDVQRYWSTAPQGIKAMLQACRQSQPINSRAELERRFDEALQTDDQALPSDWGGYRVTPDMIEFWQGRANRLQDRLRLTRTDTGWRTERLMP